MHKSSPWPKRLAYLGAAIVLGCVFALYLQPGFIVDLAGRLWNCM